MNGINEWISSIVCYLLFTAVVMNLLPNGKYEKYLRLFAGCVLILLILKPVTGGLRLEEKIDSVFRSLSLEYEIGEFAGELDEMEEKRLERLIGQYEAAAEEEITRLARKEGIPVQSARVRLVREGSREDFGRVQGIELEIGGWGAGAGKPEEEQNRRTGSEEAQDRRTGSEEAQDRRAGAERTQEIRVRQEDRKMEQIYVERIETAAVGKEAKADGNKAAEAVSKEAAADGAGNRMADAPAAGESYVSEAVRRLRREIAEYYQVEEKYVEIRLEN